MDANTSEHLRLLSVFHYVVAAFGALLSLMPLIYVFFGTLILSGALTDHQQKAPPPAIGWLVVAIGVFLMLIALSCVVLVALAGRFISQQRHWMFCMVVAALCCAFFPVGTVLGVFTMLILSKPEVRAAFQATNAPLLPA